MTIDTSIKKTVASLKMEGYHGDDDSIRNCKDLLENKITWEEYMDIVKRRNKIISPYK